jgi:membrane protease YdiL (CAAX protease family)
MSNSDPLPEPPEPEPREHVRPDLPPVTPPSGSPVDRPRTDDGAFTDQPLAETWAAPTYPDYDRDALVRPSPPGNPLADWGVFGSIVWWFIRPGTPHPQFFWACAWMLLFMFVTQGLGMVITAVLLVVQIALAPNRDALLKEWTDAKAMSSSADFARMMWPPMLITEIITIVAALAALRLIAGPSWARKIALRLPSLPHVALVLLALPAFVLLGQWADEFAKFVDTLLRENVFDYSPLVGDLDSMMAMIGYWPLWLGVLIIGIGPGIGEELFCRGFLGRGLVGTHGVFWGVLWASVLFGVMHVLPRQVIYAPVMGVFLHIIYLTTRSLLMPMLVHALNNSLGVLMMWSDKSGTMPEWMQGVDQAGKQPSFLLVYIGAAVLMAAVVIGLYISRARLVGVDGGPPRWQPPYPSVEYPPPGSGTVVSRPFHLGLAALGLGLLGMLAFVACCFACYALS